MKSVVESLNAALEAEVAKVAEQNKRLEQLASCDLEENLRRSVELCVQTMQNPFYPTLGNQARRVFELCHAMGQSLELPTDQRQSLEIAAWIHDFGLVGVPRQLIKRWEDSPSSLSQAEQSLVHQHPILGEELARFADPHKDVGRISRAHHGTLRWRQGIPTSFAASRFRGLPGCWRSRVPTLIRKAQSQSQGRNGSYQPR